MQKWDYVARVYPVTEPIQSGSFLGASYEDMKGFGQEGWDFVTVIYTGGSLVYYYKRPFQAVGEHTNPTAPAAPRDL
jgi:hypothetical protein